MCYTVVMENKVSAKDRRLDAIGAITHKYIDRETGLVNTSDREEVGREIAKLWQLGRTVRWNTAVRQWIDMVVEGEPVSDLRWAILQGAIFTGFKA